MENKKSNKANLESHRKTFFQIGLIIAIGLTIFAFEWQSESSKINMNLGCIIGGDELEDVIITRPKPEEVKPKKTKAIEYLDIIKDEEIIDEQEPLIFDEDPDSPVVIKDITPDIEEPEDDYPVFFASEMPKYPGGELALRKDLANLVNYPTLARENGIEGKVYVRFVVTKYGEVKQVQIARGTDPLLDKEAIRVVKLLKKFKPGENRGRPVSVWFTVPLNFRLN